MVPRILTIVAVLLLALFALDWFFLRGRPRNQPIARPWDVAPIIGFLGAVLLSLAYVESTRREVVDAWRWGIAFGFLLTVCAGLAMIYRGNRRVAGNASGLRARLRIVQTYGLVLLFGILGMVIAVRVIGVMLEVFIASALGTLVVAIAIAVFAVNWRKKSVRMTNDQ